MALIAFFCGCILVYGTNAVSPEVTVGQLGRQLMLQQLFMEEKIRSDGDSGIKILRLNSIGPRPYYAESFSSARKVAAIHNHDNNIRTIGMGEFVAVLNGVEFRTRHNDYRLYRPTNTSEYHAVEDIPFPDVPPEVLQYTEVQDQINEMREWFKAFKDQNITHRDYRPYFKANLCYLEGAWTTSTDTLEESFESDRHFTDAESWYDLQEKIRFTSYTGRKSLLENFSYLPTTIIEFINETIPVMAQWNYRILCHQLDRDLPTNRMRVVDDLVTRMRDHKDFYGFSKSRAARFQLNPVDSNEWTTATPRKQLMDKLMGQIPGVDNYGAKILDATIGGVAYDVENENKPLNVAYYNRAYKVDKKDAMGLDVRRRGFNDQSVFMAATTQPEIAPMSATFCEGRGRKKKCEKYTERWTYAFPLEMIYMTPLSTWNPYNLKYRGNHNTDKGKKVTANKRNGGKQVSKAYDGLNSKVYMMTPAEFYSGSDVGDKDPADTSTGYKWVLDQSGVPRKVSTSGTRIIMQPIPGVGSIRQRYPIMPIHEEGNTIYKELEALKDIVLEPKKFGHMIRGEAVENLNLGLNLKMGPSSAKTGAHEHFITLTGDEVEKLYAGEAVRKLTSDASHHHHNLTIVQRKKKPQNTIYYKYIICDGETRCKDKHRQLLSITDE